METGTTPTIVVGVSGSRGSAAALRWAADEARRRDARLQVVLCWTAKPRAYYAPSRGCGENTGAEYARQLAATVCKVLDGDAPHGVETNVVEGSAERVLIDRSSGADLLVLGSASRGQAGRVVGPVIRACLSRARCPVVVVGQGDRSGSSHQDQPSHDQPSHDRHGYHARRPAVLSAGRCRTVPAQRAPVAHTGGL